MSEYTNDAVDGIKSNSLVFLIFTSDLKIHRMFRSFRRSQKAPARKTQQDIYTLNGFAFEQGYYYYFRINGTGGSITKSSEVISDENYYLITKITTEQNTEVGLEYGFEYTHEGKTEQYRIFTYSDATVPYCLDMLIPEITVDTDENRQKNKVINDMNTTLVYTFFSKLISYTTNQGIDYLHVIYFLHDGDFLTARSYMNELYSLDNQLTTLYTNTVFNGISDTYVLGIYTECISEVIKKIKNIDESKLESFLTVFRFEPTNDEQMTLRFVPFKVISENPDEDYIKFMVKTEEDDYQRITSSNRSGNICLLRNHEGHSFEVMYKNVEFYYAGLPSIDIENQSDYNSVTQKMVWDLGLSFADNSQYTVYNFLDEVIKKPYGILTNNLTIMVEHLRKAFYELNTSPYGYLKIRYKEWTSIYSNILFQLESFFYQLANKAYKLNADGSYSWFDPLEVVWKDFRDFLSDRSTDGREIIFTMQEYPETWYKRSKSMSDVTNLLERGIGDNGTVIQYNGSYYYVNDITYKIERSWGYKNGYTIPLVYLFLSRTYTLTDYLYFLKYYYETYTESPEIIRTLMLDNKLIIEDAGENVSSLPYSSENSNDKTFLSIIKNYTTPRYLNYDDITRVYRAFMQSSGDVMELIQSTFTYVYHDYKVQFKGYQANSSESGYLVGYGYVYVIDSDQEGQSIIRQLTIEYGPLDNVTDNTVTFGSKNYNRVLWFSPNTSSDPQTTVPATVELLRFQLNDFNEVEKMKKSDPVFIFKYEQEFLDWYTRWQVRLNALYDNLKKQANRCTEFSWYSGSNKNVYSEIQFTEEEVIKWVTQMNNVIVLDELFSIAVVDNLNGDHINSGWLTTSMKGRIMQPESWTTTEKWRNAISNIISNTKLLYDEEQEGQKLYKNTDLNDLTDSKTRKARWQEMIAKINSLSIIENYTEPSEVPIVDIRDYNEQYNYISKSSFIVTENLYENVLCMTKADPSELQGIMVDQKWQITTN